LLEGLPNVSRLIAPWVEKAAADVAQEDDARRA
jgi:hypothetical protein